MTIRRRSPAWHFPQTADGVYAGHYPATGEAAIAHLESLRAMKKTLDPQGILNPGVLFA